MPETTKMPTSCDATDSCTDACPAEPTTCEEFEAMTADDGCAANCCESFTKPYGDALCSEQASICPADMVLNKEASYMDMTTNQDTNCGDADTYCGMNDCGDKTALQTYFASQTDCCEGGSDTTGAPERNVCTATFDDCRNAYSSGEYRIGIAADSGFFPCNYEDEICASNEYQSKVCRSGITTLSGEVLDELRCFGCVDFSGCCDNDLFIMAALAPYPGFNAIKDCQSGIAMMSTMIPKEQLCAMTWGDLARANGIAVDESVTTTLLVGEICGSSCGHECRQGTREPIAETKQPTEAETTKPPSDGCSCEDMVSMEDFEALREAVRELQGSIGTIEADNNDLMDGMMDMATCMSGMTDKFGKDTTMMPTAEDKSTIMPEDKSTMPEDKSTEMPTSVAPTDPETLAPTEEWETIGELWVDDNGFNKCSTNRDERSFKLAYTNTANCLSRCKDDATCVYATTEERLHCIGCKMLTEKADEWYAYKIYGKGRRELSEIEQLRAENAALKAELARRN